MLYFVLELCKGEVFALLSQLGTFGTLSPRPFNAKETLGNRERVWFAGRDWGTSLIRNWERGSELERILEELG